MKENELKALVSLLDDTDQEILSHIEKKIISLGEEVIPFLESEWENNFDPKIQSKIENLIHELQFNDLQAKFRAWATVGNQDLLEGLWLLATLTYPDLELAKIKKDFEQLYYDAWLEFRNDMNHLDQIRTLNYFFFNQKKFRPNNKNFHAPANSFINNVLESQRGNPLSLCCIYMLIANKLKLPVYGVNMPNLFILSYKTPEVQFYINVFNKGIVFSRKEIDSYISQLNMQPKSIYYEPCNTVTILIRAINNLVIAYKKIGDKEKVDELRILLEILQ